MTKPVVKRFGRLSCVSEVMIVYEAVHSTLASFHFIARLNQFMSVKSIPKFAVYDKMEKH